MKDRILTEPTFFPGLIVWGVAVTIFPLQLGLSGGTAISFIGYVAIAGFLLAVADALLNPLHYHRLGDVVLQSLFWMIGIAVPALLAFAIGAAAAPTELKFSDELCALGGLEGRYDHDDRTDTAVEDLLEAMDNC